MLKLTCSNKTKHAAFAALFLTALGLAATAHAQTQSVAVPSTVTGNGMLGYTYNYSVTNMTTADLAEITIPANPSSALMNLTAPTGFLITFDSGNGLFSLLEDNNPSTTQTFAPNTTVTGFSFTSFYAPGTVAFDSFNAGGNEFTGSTTAPSAIPEPTSTLLLAVGAAVVGGSLLRRRPARQPASV